MASREVSEKDMAIVSDRIGRGVTGADRVYVEFERNPFGSSLCLHLFDSELHILGWDREGEEIDERYRLTEDDVDRMQSVFRDARSLASVRPAPGVQHVFDDMDVVVAFEGQFARAECIASSDQEGLFRRWCARLWECVLPLLPASSRLTRPGPFLLPAHPRAGGSLDGKWIEGPRLLLRASAGQVEAIKAYEQAVDGLRVEREVVDELRTWVSAPDMEVPSEVLEAIRQNERVVELVREGAEAERLGSPNASVSERRWSLARGGRGDRARVIGRLVLAQGRVEFGQGRAGESFMRVADVLRFGQDMIRIGQDYVGASLLSDAVAALDRWSVRYAASGGKQGEMLLVRRVIATIVRSMPAIAGTSGAIPVIREAQGRLQALFKPSDPP